MTMRSVHAFLVALRKGNDIPDTYDSDDDPETLIGKKMWIRLLSFQSYHPPSLLNIMCDRRWAENKYYLGTVLGYNDVIGLHHIMF